MHWAGLIILKIPEFLYSLKVSCYVRSKSKILTLYMWTRTNKKSQKKKEEKHGEDRMAHVNTCYVAGHRCRSGSSTAFDYHPRLDHLQRHRRCFSCRCPSSPSSPTTTTMELSDPSSATCPESGWTPAAECYSSSVFESGHLQARIPTAVGLCK